MILRSPLQPHDDALQRVVHHLQNSHPNSWSEAAENIARLSSEVDLFESKLQQLKEQAPFNISESEEDIQKSNKSESKIPDITQVLDLKYEVRDLNSQASDIIHESHDHEEDIHKSDKSESNSSYITKLLNLKYEISELRSQASNIIGNSRDLLYDVCDLKSVVLDITAKLLDLSSH